MRHARPSRPTRKGVENDTVESLLERVAKGCWANFGPAAVHWVLNGISEGGIMNVNKNASWLASGEQVPQQKLLWSHRDQAAQSADSAPDWPSNPHHPAQHPWSPQLGQQLVCAQARGHSHQTNN